MIKLITDSTAYLPEDLTKKYDIDIISLSVILGPEALMETQITNEAFFEKLDNSNYHPTSSQPSVEMFTTLFEKYIAKGDTIIFTCISSDMSGTYSNAASVRNMMQDKYPEARIEIIDSKSTGMQLGFAVLAGAKALQEGKSVENIVSIIKAKAENSLMLFIPEDIMYLQKSGRLSKAGAIAASMLNIVPILTVKNGLPDLFTKIRTRIKAKKAMLSELEQAIQSKEVTDICVVHINNEKEASEMIAAIKEMIDVDIAISSIGPVLGSHVGPGTVGVVWCWS